MKIEFIYTFDKAEQEQLSFPFVMEILKDKGTLIDFAAAGLHDEDKNDLIKISCCVDCTKDEYKNAPEWFNECKGKIWVDDLESWRTDRGIKSKVSKKFLKEFAEANS